MTDTDLARNLLATREFITRYVVMSDEQADMCALWVAHTWAIRAFYFSPYLHVTAAAPECGKTRLGVEVIGSLVPPEPRPILSMNASTTAMFRAYTDGKADLDPPPVLIYDEIDNVFTGTKKSEDDNRELRALFNAGYQRGVPALRCVGPNHMPTYFPVFGAKVLIGIGDVLPDATASRCIRIRLEKKLRSERVARWRAKEGPEQAEPLRAAWRAWAAAGISELSDVQLADDDFPPTLTDRQCDGWEPLLLIARAAGPDWSQRGEAAAVSLSRLKADAEDRSFPLRVLRVAWQAFEETNAERLSTHDLVVRIATAEESAFEDWAEKGADGGQPARGAPHRLGKHLREFLVRSKQLKIDGKNVRGYERADIAEAAARYLSATTETAPDPETPFGNATSATTRMVEPKTADFETLPDALGSASENGANPHGQRDVAEVAFVGAGSGIDAPADGLVEALGEDREDTVPTGAADDAWFASGDDSELPY